MIFFCVVSFDVNSFRQHLRMPITKYGSCDSSREIHQAGKGRLKDGRRPSRYFAWQLVFHLKKCKASFLSDCVD